MLTAFAGHGFRRNIYKFYSLNISYELFQYNIQPAIILDVLINRNFDCSIYKRIKNLIFEDDLIFYFKIA